MNRPVSMSLHEQVRTTLLSEIERGAFSDDRLPPEPELCQRFGVSRITVRRAVADLEELGVVTRRQGLGTFISPRFTPVASMSVGGFADSLTGKGAISRTMILAEEQPADEETARALRIEVNAPTFRLVRTFLLDGVPLSMDDSRYSLARFPGFSEKVTPQSSTYQILRDDYGVIFHSVERRIGVSFTTEESAGWLKRPEHDALVLIEKVATDRTGDVIHVSRVETVPSRIELKMVALEDEAD
ncbi:GntR family transcriptional regulator [Microbacterium mitrae]|uniref:GntR family transcriptional regulator n=1 Tax=Microbacterium mitrae TaxID=664640 RepID=A0A5C8HK56_9MICO|nr:GntR family transcriptional regulator [Microbacterium mitrae]TXK03350.1 GntR family transcriptional regulator [Microbacterium mitrae]